MGCVLGKEAKAAVAPVPDTNLAMLSLQRVIPTPLSETGGGSGKGLGQVFADEAQRQAFICKITRS